MNTKTNQSNPLKLLQEGRQRLITCLCAFTLCLILFSIFSQHLYHLVAIPLLKQFPAQSHLIATSLTTPLITPLKLALALAVFTCAPLLAYQCWQFIKPALYQQEKRFFWIYCISSILLFYLGITFAYLVSMPLMFKFLLQFTPQDITVLPDMAQYLDLILTLCLAFGLTFQVPIITCACLHTKLLSIEQMQSARPIIIISAFILGMILTPPDVISQILLAIPLWILFEIGLAGFKLINKKSHINKSN